VNPHQKWPQAGRAHQHRDRGLQCSWAVVTLERQPRRAFKQIGRGGSPGVRHRLCPLGKALALTLHQRARLESCPVFLGPSSRTFASPLRLEPPRLRAACDHETWPAMLAVLAPCCWSPYCFETLRLSRYAARDLAVLRWPVLTDNNLEAIPVEPRQLLSLPGPRVAQLHLGWCCSSWLTTTARSSSIVQPATRLATARPEITALLVMVGGAGLFRACRGSLLPTTAPALFRRAMVCSHRASSGWAMLRLLSGHRPACGPDREESAVNDPCASGVAVCPGPGQRGERTTTRPGCDRRGTPVLSGGLLGFLAQPGPAVGALVLSTASAGRVSPSVLRDELPELMLWWGHRKLLGGSGLLARSCVRWLLETARTCDQPAMRRSPGRASAKNAELMLFLLHGPGVDPEGGSGVALVRLLCSGELLRGSLMVQDFLVRPLPGGEDLVGLPRLCAGRCRSPWRLGRRTMFLGRLMPSLALGWLLWVRSSRALALCPWPRPSA